MSYTLQQLQNYNLSALSSSTIQRRFKPLHDPISEVQSKDEFSINADILSSQQINSVNKQALQFDKKNKQQNIGSALDIIKMNAMQSSIEMSQRMIGSQICPINNNKSFVSNIFEEQNCQNNTPKNTTNHHGDYSLCLSNSHDHHSNGGIDQNEKISTTYDPSNNLATKPTLSFMNQNFVTPMLFSNNNLDSYDDQSENDDNIQEEVADEKRYKNKSKFSKLNHLSKINGEAAELIFMNCPHCLNYISLTVYSQQNSLKTCDNFFHRIFSGCYSCSCTNGCNSTQNQTHQCPECRKDINTIQQS